MSRYRDATEMQKCRNAEMQRCRGAETWRRVAEMQSCRDAKMVGAEVEQTLLCRCR